MSNVLLLRRRSMMSGKIEPATDGKVWAYYDVTDISAPTSILSSTTNIASMNIDGVEVNVSTTSQFNEVGVHLVKYTLTDATIIANNNFKNIARLSEIYLPATIVSYGKSAFEGCSNTVFHFLNLNGITVKNASFYNCQNLEIAELTLEQQNFEENIFTNAKIERFYLPNVVSISRGALTSHIREVHVGEYCTSIGQSAINSNYGLKALDLIVIKATTPPRCGSYNFTYHTTTFRCYVPYSADHSIIAAYKVANEWNAIADYMYELDENGEIPV